MGTFFVGTAKRRLGDPNVREGDMGKDGGDRDGSGVWGLGSGSRLQVRVTSGEQMQIRG